MRKEISSIYTLVWITTWITVKNETGWAWYWVALALFAVLFVNRIIDAFLER